MLSAKDRNFDDLAHRFKRNVYDRLKGQIRLHVLKRDLAEHIPVLDDWTATLESPLEILDAGGGQGQFSLELAKLRHHVSLCDISAKMLALARAEFNAAGISANFHHCSIQQYCANEIARYDLVLCHAVLEWVAEPQVLLQSLYDVIKPGGFLSLTFYNLDGMIMKNLLRANFGKVVKEDFTGYRGSLTPTWPRKTDEVLAWLQPLDLTLTSYTGIRCFHDYILDPSLRDKDPQQQLALELKLSQQEPYRSLGRYIHLLLQKPTHGEG